MEGYKGSEVENAVYILQCFRIRTLSNTDSLYSHRK